MILPREAGERDHAKHGGGGGILYPPADSRNRAENHDNLFLNAPPAPARLSCCRLFSLRGVVDPSGDGEESGARAGEADGLFVPGGSFATQGTMTLRPQPALLALPSFA
jgi:hypothetical protein